ncbi:hydrolase [Virgisporangium ochraceum]|uniref:Hydrolase n=2 Tax=Virgisporangium ochraceum TaxID=65505 RepID=A0A8J3ZP66_9ACTN|nr:hydrolase [Virgisporangium ochraceum]
MHTVRMCLVAVCVVMSLVAGCGSPRPSGSAPPAAAASAVPSVSAAPVTPAPGTHTVSLSINGTRRAAVVYAPPSYVPGTPVPLVIGLHCRPCTGTFFRQLSGFDAVADRHGFLVAYPDGVNGTFNGMTCCGSADDVTFLRELARELVTTWGADADRVHLAGISNGGDMSYRAAVETTGVFAAIGVVSAGYAGARAADAAYVPRSPVSLITVIGTADGGYSSYDTGVTRWQERLRCTPAPATAPAPAVARTVAACADGSTVDVYRVTGMAHVWPGAAGGTLGWPEAPFSATEVLWRFFAEHPRTR